MSYVIKQTKTHMELKPFPILYLNYVIEMPPSSEMLFTTIVTLKITTSTQSIKLYSSAHALIKTANLTRRTTLDQIPLLIAETHPPPRKYNPRAAYHPRHTLTHSNQPTHFQTRSAPSLLRQDNSLLSACQAVPWAAYGCKPSSDRRQAAGGRPRGKSQCPLALSLVLCRYCEYTYNF